MTPREYRPDAAGCSQPTDGADAGASPPPRTAAEVLHRYRPRVYGLALRMLGNAADAEDVTQEVLLQMVRWLETFRGEARFTTWLGHVTVNAALAYRHTRARRRERERQVDAPQDVLPGAATSRCGVAPRGPEQVALDREAWALVERAVGRMPEIYRDVFVLAEVEGLANAEVGDLLSLSLPAVKSRLHRARLLLRAALAPYVERPDCFPRPMRAGPRR
jgi:RNA polymerase sigma-70 factor (ECF subfamily)